MFPLGEAAFRTFVVEGDGDITDSLTSREIDTESALEIKACAPPVSDTQFRTSEVDSVVLDGNAFADAGLDAVTTIRETAPQVPVVLLVSGGDPTIVCEALAAGAADALPRRLATDHPEIFVERVAALTEHAHTASAIEDIYDGVSSPVSIHAAGTGRMVHANQALCDLLGYDRKTLLSMRIGDITADIQGYDHERAMHLVVTATHREEPLEVQWPLQTEGGSVRWLEAELMPVTIGGREYVLSASTEVTERRRREREYEAIFDAVNDVITVHDPWEKQLVDVNESLCDITGYSKDALLSMGVSGFSADSEEYTAGRAYAIQQRVATTGEPETLEWAVETVDGDNRRLECVLSPATIAGQDRVLVLARDVTERRQLEASYRELFESVSDGLVVHDPASGEIVDANERYCELTGYSHEELVGSPVRLVLPENTEKSDEAIDRIRAAREEGPQLFEIEGERKNGQRFPAEVHLRVVEIRGEERVLASVRDITERKRREREYEQIFDGVQDAIILMDPDTMEILDANDAYFDLVGYDDLESLREQGVDGLSATAEGFTAAEGKAIHERVAKSGEPEIVEWAAETKDGARRWLEVKIAPAVIGGDEVHIAIHRDVTERKRREREFEQIFNGVNDVISVYNPQSGELLEVNDTLCELTGYDRETILEDGLDIISATDDGYSAERATDILRDVASSGEPRELEWCLRTADGDRRWLEVNASPATINGEQRLLTISRDITERRRSERRLRAILDRIDEAIFLTRADALTDASQEPDYVSAGYEEIYGLSLDEIQQQYEQGFFGTLHPEDEPDHRAFVEAIVADVTDGSANDRYTTEYRIIRPDGSHRWVQADYYPVNWESEPPRIVIVSRDITTRKKREQRLASFEEATDDLTTADSREEAARAAVAAATDALDMSAVGVLLYDRERGVLEPTALSSELPAAILEHSVGPSDGALWTAFATGDIVAPDDTIDSENAANPLAASDDLEDWRGIPLGNHGVLFAGSPDSLLDPNSLQSAHVLAATLEAALNHLRGERQLASRAEQLRSEAERADRLDRIARLTQQVEAAITDASAASDVERAVCHRLVDTNPYEVAWIGNVEVGTDRITPSTVVGEPARYVDAMELAATDDSDCHPAVEAWRSDAATVEDTIVGSGPAADWREHMLANGYQSVCAVPLTYNGVTHGVLCVAADAPNAFSDRAREVLDQLGTSIAHALAGIERRHALESDETVELEFRGAGTALSFAQLAADANCRVRHDRTVQRDDGTVSVYYAFQDDPDPDLIDLARTELAGEVVVVRDGTEEILLEVRTDTWFGAPLAEYGAVLRRASATPYETTLIVELPTGTDVRSFTERVQKLAPSLELEARRQHQRGTRTAGEIRNRIEADLTDRQHEALRTAFAEGYFEWPRESDGSEVADRLGITQPTFNKHLRLAEQKTFASLFEHQA